MKVASLFKPWKPKKPKKLPDPWFFGVGAGYVPVEMGGDAVTEGQDDWEAEVATEEWTSFKVQPREGAAGWMPFAATAKVFDMAFGAGNWGQSGIPKEGTFEPMKVSTRPETKINYAPLRDNGYKIVFFEIQNAK